MQLTTLAFLLLVTGGASAEEVASLSGFVYADSDGTLVSAPQASVSAGISEGVTLNAKFTVDTVTAASRVIDGISSATPEVRQMGSFGVTYEKDMSTVSGLVNISREPDYNADTLGVGYSRDFAQRCTTLAFYLWHGEDEITPNRNGFYDEVQQKQTTSVRASLTQVLTPDSVVSGTLEYIQVSGYQSNPYYVSLVGLLEDDSPYYADNNPTERRRWAVSGQYDQWLPIKGAIHPFLRLYSDDWGVRSVTSDISYTQHIGPLILTSIHYRFYQQTASHYFTVGSLYDSSFQSVDFKYDALNSHMVGARTSLDLEPIRSTLKLTFVDQMRLYATYDFYQQTRDHGSLTASFGQAGLSTTF